MAIKSAIIATFIYYKENCWISIYSSAMNSLNFFIDAVYLPPLTP